MGQSLCAPLLRNGEPGWKVVPRLFVSLTIIAALAAALPAEAGDAGFKLLEIEGHPVKWGSPQPGRGAVVTWRLAFARGTAPGRENCKQTTGIDGLLRRSGLEREDAMRAADAAFAMWSKAADIRFVPAGTGETADITIAAETDDDGVAYTDVTPGLEDGHITPLSRAVVCLNPQAKWTTAPEGTYRLVYVLAHEIGHAIGLDHPSPAGALMSFEYDSKRSRLTPGDAAGAAFLYGTAQRIVSTR
jgi:hypothetical protein